LINQNQRKLTRVELTRRIFELSHITDVVCVIDRESGERENLAAEGIRLHALFTMSELKEAALT